jgi:glycosyltransferase involved in cell wall biosynthesis
MKSDKKRRILFIGEASFLSTGFSTYWNEVIRRLYDTGEFEIAELGSYAHDDDPRCQQVPWKFYPVAPARSNQSETQRYTSNPTNQFGEWRFDDICLDWKPDLVIGIRDWWMDEFVLRSPLRKNFKFIWMPTIDGEPQRDLWLDSYRQCDGILTYSEYGMDLLKKTGRNGTKLITIASPGADLEVFKPPDNKREHKARLGIDPNSLIVGTVMRNQKRKLYYDLIEGFSKWQKHSKTKGHTELAKKTFLYLHTSYPDVGYDIGKAIQEFNVGNRVIMTYLCNNCQTAYPSFFAGEITHCRKCHQLAAHPPNANHSCPRNVLADIMKTFDLYVQYSICLHPDTPVMASGGWKNIGDIRVGDEVIGKDGLLHRVYKTMRNPSDTCMDVTVKGRPWSITATNNHPWLVVDKAGLSKGIESIVNRERYYRDKLAPIRSNQLEAFRDHAVKVVEDKVLKPIAEENDFEDIPAISPNDGNQCPSLKFVYKRTDELRPGDLLVNKIPEEEILPDYDLPFMDEDMAYYLGLFAADGHANETCGQCTLTSHSSEAKDVFGITQKIAARIGKNAHQQSVKGRNAVVTNICDTKLRNVIRKICYNEDRTKQLPSGCHLWPRKLQESIVRGLMYGDGCQTKECLNIYCTTSVHIAKMLCPILERLGWYYCCHIQYRDNDGKLPMYRFEIRIDGQRKSHETLYHDGFVLTKVKSVDPNDFDGEVVNIDVEDDHNYVTLEGLQHNCEGFGMPCAEAQACGIPVAAVDYSAMQDHLKCPGSIPIEVGRFFREAIVETEQKRALPDNNDFVRKLDRFLKQSEAVRNDKIKQTRDYIIEPVPTYGQSVPMRRRGWERTAAIWGQIIREIPIIDSQTTWFCPTSRAHTPQLTPPSNNMNNSEFVNWVIGTVWNRPDMLRTHFAGEWLQSLNSGSRTMGDRRVPFGRKELVEHFVQMVQQANAIEEKRLASMNDSVSDQVKVTVL